MARRLARDFDYGDNGIGDLSVPIKPAPVAAPETSPIAAPAPAASDPYAALRNLQFNKSTQQSDQGEYVTSDLGETQATSWVPKIVEGPEYWQPDFGALKSSGFQSKYNRTEDITGSLSPEAREKLGGQQVFQTTFQRPGMHKYDTMDAYYVMDPATGQARMVGEPTPTRQISSVEQTRDAFEEGIKALAPMVLSAFAPGIGAAMGAGTGIAGTAVGGATVGATNAALQGKSGSDILKAAAIGGIGSAGGSYLSGLDAASKLGITDPSIANIVNKAVQSGANSALQTGLKGGDIEDIAASFGTSALTSGVGAGAGELAQLAEVDPRLINLAVQANKVYENPTASGILGLTQSGAGYFGGKEPATDVVGEKYPELVERAPFPFYESIDNSGLQPFEPIAIADVPAFDPSRLNGTEPSQDIWADRGPGEGGYDFFDFNPAPSPAPSQADMEYFLSTNIPNKPETVQDLMAQYYPEPTQAPSPVNPFADLPADEAGQTVEVIGIPDDAEPFDPYGPGSGWGEDVLPPGYEEPPPEAVAPPVSIRPPAPSIKIPVVGGAPSPAPATKAKSDKDMAGLFALLGAMGGGQQAAPENYQVADVRNATMAEMLRSMGLSA